MTSPIESTGYRSVAAQKEYTLPVVGPVPISDDIKTSHKMVEEYKKWLSVIEEIMKKDSFTNQDLKDIQEAINQLTDLAKNGDTSTTPPSYMQPEMLNYLEGILGLFQSQAGIVPYGQIDPQKGIEGLKTLKAYELSASDGTKISIESLLADAIGLSGSDKSLLDMLYLDFFLAANTQYEKELAELEEALSAAKDIGELLAKIQELRNRMIQAPEDDPSWTDDPNNPVSPVIAPIKPEDLEELSRLAKELENQIQALKSPPLNETDEDGTLSSALQKVLDDIKWSIELGDELAELDELGTTTPDGTYPADTEAERKKIWEESGLPWPTEMESVDEPWNDPYWQKEATRAWYEMFPWLSPEEIDALIEADGAWTGTDQEKKDRWDLMTSIDTWKAPENYDRPIQDPWNHPEYMQPAIDIAKPKRVEEMMKGGMDKKMHDWLLDGQDTTGSTSGKYQDDIDKAMSANTNFNSAQNEHLKAANYDFEQVSKMFAEFMEKISKNVQSMAQASRGG